ncbi:hypothetical protein AAG570_004245 [Ranatra chinensis]|uniref:Groucho/TLE N-terminal Q-rich domain-containing protein n=1 Tax=Ranatra chinensis TaxID=642074 RepID=A0ABD0Y379_9HEMI
MSEGTENGRIGPPQPGQPFKFTVGESCDRIKEEFNFLQAQYHKYVSDPYIYVFGDVERATIGDSDMRGNGPENKFLFIFFIRHYIERTAKGASKFSLGGSLPPPV